MIIKKAVMWTGFNVSEVENAFFGNVSFSKIAVYTNRPVPSTAHVHTSHGLATPGIGDYILENEDGNIFVLSPMQYSEISGFKTRD